MSVDEYEAYLDRQRRESSLDHYKQTIIAWLREYPTLSAAQVCDWLKEHYNVECRVAGNTVSYRHPQYLNKNGEPVSVRGSRLGELYTRKGIEYELAKKYTRSHAAGGIVEPVAENTAFEGRRPAGGGGQIPGHAAARDGGQALRGADELHARHAERASKDEKSSAAPAGLAGRVPAKRKKRRR